MDLTTFSPELTARTQSLSTVMLALHHVLDSREPWHYHCIGFAGRDEQIPADRLDHLIVRRKCIACHAYAFMMVNGRQQWGPALDRDCATAQFQSGTFLGRYWRHNLFHDYKKGRAAKAWLRHMRAQEQARKKADADRERGIR